MSLKCSADASHELRPDARRGDVCGATVCPEKFELLNPDDAIRRFLVDEHWHVPPRCMAIIDYPSPTATE